MCGEHLLMDDENIIEWMSTQYINIWFDMCMLLLGTNLITYNPLFIRFIYNHRLLCISDNLQNKSESESLFR